MNLDDLGPIRDALERHGLWANKAFGQHFLLDLNITRRIAKAAGDLTGVTVLEVGPGPGGLTRALLEADAHVVAVEKDRRFLPLLQELADAADDRLTVVEGDAQTVDQRALPGPPTRVVANLPYNVGTPLLVDWLTGPFRPELMVLMFQKEVARRIVAPPGADDYGRLAVLAQATSEARIALDLPARAFTPPPKVDSSVVVLAPRTDRPNDARLAALERVTRAAFGQRRKMLRSSLKPLGGEQLCERAGIDPTVRAETLDGPAFLALADTLLAR